MKKLIILLPLLAILSCSDVENSNPKNAFVNANGCVECDNYAVGDTFVLNERIMIVADRSMLDSALSNGEDLTKFCVSKVTSLYRMFDGKDTFNQDISSWDVSGVTDMGRMFSGAKSFNQDIGNWDVSNVNWMNFMFDHAYSFNQNIGNWDVSGVREMMGMFSYSQSFNQDIGKWDVSNNFLVNGVNMEFMFDHATSFDQDLTQWCVSNFRSKPFMFSSNSALKASNHPKWGTCP